MGPERLRPRPKNKANYFEEEIMKKYPKTIFVYRDNEGTEDEFFMVCEKIEEAAELNKSRIIGLYELKGTGLVKTKVELETNLILKIRKK